MALLAASAGEGKNGRPVRICGQVVIGKAVYLANAARGEFVVTRGRPASSWARRLLRWLLDYLGAFPHILQRESRGATVCENEAAP